jgi:hypothetical protein
MMADQLNFVSVTFIAMSMLIGLFLPLGLWLLLPILAGGGIGLLLWQIGYGTLGASLALCSVFLNVGWYLYWDERL